MHLNDFVSFALRRSPCVTNKFVVHLARPRRYKVLKKVSKSCIADMAALMLANFCDKCARRINES